MNHIWRPIDAIANWVLRMSTRTQLRIGVVCILVSLPFWPYLLFSNEPPGTLFLTVFTTTLAGFGMVTSAQPEAAKDDSVMEEAEE